MNVEKIIVRLHIEEDNRSSNRRFFSLAIVKIDVVRHDQSSKRKSPSSSNKGAKVGPRGDVNKKKFFGTCFNCDQIGHKSLKCKKLRKKHANLNERVDMDLCDVVLKVNLMVQNRDNNRLILVPQTCVL